jgi:hypothetical protein
MGFAPHDNGNFAEKVVPLSPFLASLCHFHHNNNDNNPTRPLSLSLHDLHVILFPGLRFFGFFAARFVVPLSIISNASTVFAAHVRTRSFSIAH